MGERGALRLSHALPHRRPAAARRGRAPRRGHRDTAVLLADHRGGAVPLDGLRSRRHAGRGRPRRRAASTSPYRPTSRPDDRAHIVGHARRGGAGRARAADAHLLAALRHRAGVRLGRRGLRAGAPEGPGRARRPSATSSSRAGKTHPPDVPGWTVHPVWPPKGLRWYVTPFVWPRVHQAPSGTPRGFDILRVHSVRFVGPAALWARRRYRLPVPVVTHHHHLDPSPLNPYLEKRVIEASDCDRDRQRVRQAPARRRARRADRSRARRVLRGRAQVRARAARRGARAALGHRRASACSSALGPLIARKNPVFLIEAFAEIRRAAGDGRLRSCGWARARCARSSRRWCAGSGSRARWSSPATCPRPTRCPC